MKRTKEPKNGTRTVTKSKQGPGLTKLGKGIKAFNQAKKPKSRPLTGKQRRFCEYYIQYWNATKAARLAGYSGDDNAMGVVGHQNLRKNKIRDYIKERMDEVAMDTDEILTRLSHWARGTVEPFLTEDGVSATLQAGTKEAKEAIGLIKKIKQTERVLRSGVVDRQFEVELHDAKDAVIQLAKIRGLFIDRVDHTSSDGSMSPPKTLAELYDEERASTHS